jgi:ATP-dependent RNA helicase DeaD
MEESELPTFESLGLGSELTAVLRELGYEAPTPVQAQTIPVMLSGKDVIGQAQTGTGKTAAFALPILQNLDPEVATTQALVLAPTRELAMQVAEAIHKYSHGKVSVLPVYGGAPMVPQLKRLQRGAQIVVGTPGRLIDHLERGSLSLTGIRTLVLDEADEMLKMGFVEEVEKILAQSPPERQVALFSATMPDEILRISKRYQSNAVHVSVAHHTMTAPAIEQRFLNLAEGQKLDVLTQLLELESSEAVLVFRRTKNGAAELAERLEARGFTAEALHGDMTQGMREAVVRRLRGGQTEIVVATDVAARGLDVDLIEHVINFDIPNDVEAYVHRIGRTGRAGRKGMATLFVTPRERRMMREIEKFTGSPIKPMRIPTRADVAAKRIDNLKESIRHDLQKGDLDLYLKIVEELTEEGAHDIAEIAAAATRIANGSRSLEGDSEDSVEQAPRTRTEAPSRYGAERPPREERSERPRYERAPRESGERSERPARPSRGTRDDSVPKIRLSIAVGSVDGIRPADVVGSIANEADVPGREIGPIDIRENITFVSVPEQYGDQVIEKLARAKFRGRPVNVKVAGQGAGEESRPPRRESAGDDRPRAPRRDAPRSGGYERPSAPRGGYERKEPRSGGYERKEPRTGGYERKSASGGGYARKESSGGGYERKGGFAKKEGGFAKKEGGYAKKEGGYARREGAPPREGGYARREAPARGGYVRKDSPAPRTGGYRDRDDSRPPRVAAGRPVTSRAPRGKDYESGSPRRASSFSKPTLGKSGGKGKEGGFYKKVSRGPAGGSRKK